MEGFTKSPIDLSRIEFPQGKVDLKVHANSRLLWRGPYLPLERSTGLGLRVCSRYRRTWRRDTAAFAVPAVEWELGLVFLVSGARRIQERRRPPARRFGRVVCAQDRRELAEGGANSV